MTQAAGTRVNHSEAIDSESLTTSGRGAVVRTAGRMCQTCGGRRARFARHGGAAKADRSHTLCFECYRAETNRVRARRLAGTFWLEPWPSPLPPASKFAADRAGLYADIDLRRRRAQIAARHAPEAAASTPSLERAS